LYVDATGTLWAATGFAFFGDGSGAVTRYHAGTDSFSSYSYNTSDGGSTWKAPVRAFLEDSHGNFWVGTGHGLQRMNRKDGTFERMAVDAGMPYAPGEEVRAEIPVYSIHEDKKGGLWVGTIGDSNYPSHLLRYDPDSRSSQIFPTQVSAWTLCESSDGTMWLASAGLNGKVLKLRPKGTTYDLYTGHFLQDAFDHSDLAKELSARLVNGPENMAIDPITGNYWLQLVIGNPPSTEGVAVMANFDPKNNKTTFHELKGLNPVFDFNVLASQFGVSGMVVDKNGTLWGSLPAGNIGIFNYDPATKQIKHYLHDPADSTSITSNEIVTLMQDSRGDIWAATFQNGVNRISPATGKITHFHFNTGDFGQTDEPIALMEANDGKIWVGGELSYEGISYIAIIDPRESTMEKLDLPDMGTFRAIYSMAQSPKNGMVVFAIANHGIGVYKPDDGRSPFVFMDSDSGLPFEFAAGVVCDEDGFFWVADIDTPTFYKFGEVQDDFVFSGQDIYAAEWRRNGMIGPNGHIYFLSWADGWLEIDPAMIRPEEISASSKVTLVDLYILGEKQKPGLSAALKEPIWQTHKIYLPSSAETFGFRFTDFNFQKSSAQFLYRLYPYETTWQRSGNSPSANYYKIPSGEYTFEVKSSAYVNRDNGGIATLQIVVLPPWWKTWWAYGAYSVMLVSGVFLADRFQRKRLLDKAAAEAKEKELEQAREIEKAYQELKATQTQLIQSEKMASLGELTAGIAHEIQNPLNFVNNFSEVNAELIDEMTNEIEKGNLEEAKAIARNIHENEMKIISHGKRADSIVKSMLHHSRSSSGTKEPTDINALASEYLRLAYHGLRAKDSTFNATMTTDFDEKIGTIQVIPQDIGRVILNLITNAFHAVSQKKNSVEGNPGSVDYVPTVTVGTKLEDGHVNITVKDNGDGIPPDIVEKIYQPFFTTKPTGQGTGLGLSMSYDIITKGHGGEIKVATEVGNYAIFTIVLPLSTKS
jgi:signal transduction histidine kinase/sugar lactone lactonase YvrE